MAFCSNCGKEIFHDYDYCPACGWKIGSNINDKKESNVFEDYNGSMKICKKCGARMPEDSFYCLNCGSLFDDLGYFHCLPYGEHIILRDFSHVLWYNSIFDS